jgi:peptidoglycan/LPS O-acetylase OafA/YrhL
MKDRIYFPNLNGLRFIAASMVIYSHMELNKSYFLIDNYFQRIKHLGNLGVVIFFVLSGFLITFLLLEEKEKKHVISYKIFYRKRILRIWPLYFMVVFLSLFILPHFNIFQTPTFYLKLHSFSDFAETILLFVLFLPNLLIQIHVIPFAAQTWSIGTEEQFYLIWPWVINNIKYLKWFFAIVIIGYTIMLHLIESPLFDTIPYFNLLRKFANTVKLDSLAIGALGAYLYFTKNLILKFFENIILFYVLLVFTIIVVVNNYVFPYYNSAVFSFLFMGLILALIINSKLKNCLESKFFIYLGKISYGLYMYHQMAMVFVINMLIKFGLLNNIAMYILSIILTIFISGLSYKFFEKPFLKMKNNLREI